jgi:hypothetical protein
MLELRHLGGALARPPAVASAVGHRDAAFNLFTSAYPGPGFAQAAVLQRALYRRLLPWTGGKSIYNFTADPDARTAFDPATLRRLTAVKAVGDPQNLFRFGVSIPL